MLLWDCPVSFMYMDLQQLKSFRSCIRRSNSWKQVNPKWKYWFWTDADNREFVEKHYPEFLDTYNKLPYEIERADMVRCDSCCKVHCIARLLFMRFVAYFFFTLDGFQGILLAHVWRSLC